MRTKSSWIIVALGLVCGALTVALLPSATLFKSAEVSVAQVLGAVGERWACPMICTVTDKPGTCPVCGMTLARMTVGELQPEQTRRMGLDTVKVTRGPAVLTVRAYGRAEYDHRFTRLVIPRVPGRIVRRFDATFGCCQVVGAGEPIIELYSEPVIAAQAELESAIRLGDSRLVQSLKDRFNRWNLGYVAEAILAGEPVRDSVVIRSPFSGQVLLAEEEMVNETLAVGREVAADTPLLRLVDPQKLVLVVHVPEHRANFVREGQRVLVESDDRGPLPQIVAVVGRVAGEINSSLRAREVRIHLDQARDVLSPGSLVSARFEVALAQDLSPAAGPHDRGEFVLVPKTAVLSTGVRHVAWRVASRTADGRVRFELAPLALGPRLEDASGNDLYVVRAGLAEGDEVATQAAFLIDSQAQLAGTPSLLNPFGLKGTATPHQH